MKRLLTLILVLGIMSFNFSFARAAESQNKIDPASQDEIKVVFNGNKLEFDVKSYSKEGRTLVPFRKILEAFGAEVSWDGQQQVVSAKKGSTEIYLKIGANYAYVNGYKVNMDVPPETKDGRTFVPLRFISENLGAEVGWNSDVKTVTILYNDTVYKMGQAGTYKDLKFTIEKVEAQADSGTLKVAGKINTNSQTFIAEVSDDYGYVLPGTMKVVKKDGDMYSVEAEISLPGCHNFEGKYLVLKFENDEQKLIRIAEYTL